MKGVLPPQSLAKCRSLMLILNERGRQDAKFGVQNHDPKTWLAILTEEVGEVAQAILHDQFGGKASGTYKTEIIHAAAVALAMIEQLEREDETRN